MANISLNISVCVVLYQSEEQTRRCMRALAASLKNFTDYEISFYDNSPTPALEDLKKFGNYIHDARNLGFSYANNQLILRSQYYKILLLNPDVSGLTEELWNKIAKIDTNETANFIRLTDPDGATQDCVGRVVSLQRAFSRRQKLEEVGNPQPVQMGIMAFMLTNRAVFAQVGLLDAAYALYAEDMDWCYRANRCGIKVLYHPEIALIHFGGASAKTRWPSYRISLNKYKSERLFINKHYRGFTNLANLGLNCVKISLCLFREFMFLKNNR